ADRVEACDTAHQGTDGFEGGAKGLTGFARHEAQGLAALHAALLVVRSRRLVVYGGGIEGGPAVSGEVCLDL
ncbi:MAG: hypothetical protein AVDCRST_MAG37-1058, partial [uncultured Rubrobacteraceae bacterium]